MTQEQREALLAAKALLAAEPPHLWAAGVLLEDLAGGVGRPIARTLRRGTVRQAREEIDVALAELAA